MARINPTDVLIVQLMVKIRKASAHATTGALR